MASCLTKGELNVIPLQFILKTCISEFTNEIVEFRERITRTFLFVLCAEGSWANTQSYSMM